MQNSKDNVLVKTIDTLREEGLKGVAFKTQRAISKKIKDNKVLREGYKDVLFIKGCDEGFLYSCGYRIKNQREQLEAFNITTGETYYKELKTEYLRLYRVFVFFNTPYTEKIGTFVKFAKRLNKAIIYDVDELTNTPGFIEHSLLELCDAAVVSTSGLAEQFQKYVPKVYVNGNTVSEDMVQISKEILLNQKRRDNRIIKIGYFSIGIMPDNDFELVIPVLKTIMAKYNFVELFLAGEISVPDELKNYEARVCVKTVDNWKKTLELISAVDINIVPLKKSIFNESKPENEWLEAALVKVVTVASNVGAFKECIIDGETGVLCETLEQWSAALDHLIVCGEDRKRIGGQAYDYCKGYYTTIRTGKNIMSIIKKEQKKNVMFVLPGIEISGGIKVALKHASILQENGVDVSLLLLESTLKWYEFEKNQFPVMSIQDTNFDGHIDSAVATMWTTLSFVVNYANIDSRNYLVQNFETDFYHEGDPLRMEANKTYSALNFVRYLTISKWCQEWLKKEFGKESLYVPNGIDLGHFTFQERGFHGKVKILIEGDCSVDYKNVDEAFSIVELLDKEIYEIWYMSYNAEPKKDYHVDKFLHKVPYADVPRVYSECDILLKTSLLESFSYPPLEMMATGGYVVAVPNEGNVEYLKDDINCLFYNAGDIEMAKTKIEQICCDENLRDKLTFNAKKTVEERSWVNVEGMIKDLYT